MYYWFGGRFQEEIFESYNKRVKYFLTVHKIKKKMKVLAYLTLIGPETY